MRNKRTAMPKQKAVILTKEQRASREEEMNLIHPGYFDRKLRLNVMLGTVLFVRGFYTLLSAVLGVTSISGAIVNMLGVLFCFAYYQYLIMGYWRPFGVILLISRIIELVTRVLPLFPYVPQMRLSGIIWWVTMTAAVLLDILFLAYLMFGKMPQMQLKDNRKINSDEPILLRSAMEHVQSVPGQADETEACGEDRARVQEEAET